MKRTVTTRLSCTHGLGLLLGMAILFSACNENDGNSGNEPAPPVRQPPQPDKGAAQAPPSSSDATPNPVIPPSPAVKAGPAETAPGLGQGTLIAPLRDAYERMDPGKDGWASEAFSASASEQLHLLEDLLGGPDDITAASLGELAVAEVSTTALRPENLSLTFDDGRFLVRRPPALPGHNTPGIAALAATLNKLRPEEGSIDPHMKIFRVFPGEKGTAQCLVLVDILNHSGQSRTQINATWSCNWRLSPDQSPVLTSIALTRYEEITQSVSSQPLFADATRTLLDQEDAYHKQFLHSSDHWRAHLPRELGLDPVANHGLAIGDINGDGLDDLYVCQQGGLPNRMFLQNPDGTLHDITRTSGAGWLEYCAAALLVDLDNDGDRDLIVSQDFRVMVMANDGNGAFTLAFGSSTKAQSFSLAAADYDNDGLVDFYICGYNPSQSELRGGAMGEPMPFHDANNGGPNMLWRNEGNLGFKDVTGVTGMNVNNTRYSFAASWEDYDNDGDQDLYVANDYGRNCLYRNDGGSFSEIAAKLRLEDTSSGMSVSWADFNLDGQMDVYTSNMFSSAGNRITYQKQFKSDLPEDVRKQFQHLAIGNSLFEGVANKPFKDVGIGAGVNMGRWAWGSKFVDFNNDGRDDILVANGFITTADTGDL